jgi:hypothetical protein
MSADTETLMLDRVQLYFDQLMDRYRFHLSVLFPRIKGQRQPLFVEPLTDREVFLSLRDAARRAALVEAGQGEHDKDSLRYAQNEDGAQERLIGLGLKFLGDL